MEAAHNLNEGELANYIPGKQNSQFLVTHDGYQFRMSKKNEKKTHYNCREKKKFDCPVTAAVDRLSNIVSRVTGVHTHDNDLLKKIVKTKENEALDSAKRNPSVAPRTILGQLATELNKVAPVAINCMPKAKAFTRKIQRARKDSLDCPAIPSTWAEMEIPENLTKTANGEQFLICDQLIDTQPQDAKVIGFASKPCIDILDSTDDMFGDGTFEIAKSTLFSQVFILNAKTQLTTKNSVPCAFYLLPNKEFLTYKIMFTSIREKGVSPPKIFYCDFENAIIKAVREVFPESTIICCDTHFKRAVRSNIQNNHLMVLYNESTTFQTFVRHLWALSLVPIDDIVRVWEDFVIASLPDEESEEWTQIAEEDDINGFITYFESNWIGNINGRTGTRQPPRFRHPLWNKYDAVRSQNDTTTNSSEGFNIHKVICAT